jgi:hypothetical protein
LFESCGHDCVVQHGEVAFLGFGRRNEADGLQKPAIVEPVHPLESCELDGLEVAPRSTSMDDLSLVEAVDRFGEGVVVRVAGLLSVPVFAMALDQAKDIGEKIVSTDWRGDDELLNLFWPNDPADALS